jgi:TolB-like protein
MILAQWKTLLVIGLLCASPALVASPSHAQDRIRIALLPMVVHSAETPGYLRRGLSDMMASRLEQIPDFEVIRVDDSEAATTNLEKALKRARKEKAEFVLFGSFTRFGTGASLDVQCAGAPEEDGEEPLRQIFVHSGSIGDVIPDLDDMVGKVARFVIRDFVDRAEAAGEVPNLPSSQAVNALEERVAALEAALQALTAQLESPPAEVAGGPEAASP